MKQRDSPLIVRLRGRDALAAREFVEQYGEKVMGFLLHAHRLSKPDAEDVTHDTLIAALGTIDRFRGDAALSTWVIGIARNQALTLKRKETRQRRLLQSLPPGPDRTAPLEPDVFRALDSLPPLEREALYLKDLQGWTLREIAVHQEVREGTATSRVRIARKKLNTLLRKGGPP